MREYTATLLTLLAGTGIAGCGGESADELLEAIADQEDRAVALDCECFWEEDGYSSPAECRAEKLTPTALRQCGIDAVRPLVPIHRSYFTCIRDAQGATLECVEAAACDESAVSTCLAMNDVCPDSPCAGLTGDRFDECQIALSRAMADIDACD